jgi:hypothetical protein
MAVVKFSLFKSAAAGCCFGDELLTLPFTLDSHRNRLTYQSSYQHLQTYQYLRPSQHLQSALTRIP